MLSTKSNTFIDNLRMYLMMSGKNEQEISELTEELKDHLIEAEKSGKSIDDIIDQTPEQYMASLKQEMKTDYKRLTKFLPIYFLGIFAYFLLGPAVRGEFQLNIIQVIGLPIFAVIGLLIYTYFLQQAGRKQFSMKKFFLGGVVSSSIVTLIAILILVVSNLVVEPFFIDNVITDMIVIAICCSIFVVAAIWSKSWLSLWLPAILIIPDVFSRFTNWDIEKILIIQIASFVLMFVALLVNIWIIEKGKKKLA
ncbi:HAAS domain-containing protein [Bacillus sinesaloumensis]|uniref:HAAS domain-containing protein n=1 Tax=Litchfieldia sinesaloumensis TaxID=1926280 RepID=UPI0009884CFE|nr:hypothetical protein [Bacillus sinesaloumensis]